MDYGQGGVTYNFNIYGLPDEQQAAGIHKALTGQAGDANPGHEDEKQEKRLPANRQPEIWLIV